MNTFTVTRGAKVLAYVPGTGFVEGTVTGKGNHNGFWFVTDGKGSRHEVYGKSIAPISAAGK